MKFILILLFTSLVFADSPGSNVYKAKTFNGDGTQGIGSILDALKVNLTNVTIPVTGVFWQTVQPVSIASPLAVTGQFYQTTQPVSIATPVAVTGQFYQAVQPVSGPLTNADLRATPLQVTGALSSSGLTDTQLRAAPLTVNIGSGGSDASANNQLVNIAVLNGISAKIPGNLTVTPANNLKVDSSGSTSIISNFPATQGISAAALPLPGGASTSDLQTSGNAILTNLNQKVPPMGQALAANSTPVVLTLAQLATLTPLTSIGVNNFPSNQSVTVTNFSSNQNISGTVVANAGTNLNTSLLALDSTVAKDASVNSLLKPASTLAAVTTLGSVTNTVTIKSDTLTNQTSALKVDGSLTTQPISAVALPLPSGAATLTAQLTGNTSVGSIDSKLITTINGLKVDNSAVTQPVSGTVAISNYPPIQAVSGSGSFTVAQPAGTNLHTIVDSGSVTVSGIPTVSITNFPATQVISGAVTANIGTTNGLSLDTSTNSLLKPASTLAAVTTVGAISSTVTIKADVPTNQTNALKVDASATTQPVSAISLPLPTGAATLAAQTTGNTSVASIDTKLSTTANGLKVDNSGVTQPISGLVTANIGTTNGLALDATLTSGLQKTLLRGNSKGTTVAADLTSTNVDANTQGLDVSIKGIPTILVTNFPASQAVTGAFFQATQPVSIAGTISTTGGLTDTQLRASAVPVSNASLPLPTGASTLSAQTTGNSSLASIDLKTPALGQALSTSSVPIVLTAAQLLTLTPLTSVTANIGTTGGLALDSTIAKDASLAAINTSVNTLLKPASTLAAVTNLSQLNGAPISMNTGLRDLGTQRVTIATNDLVPVSGTFFQSTQPVSISGTVATSGVVTANIGTTNGLALDSSVNSLLKPGSTLTAVTSVGSIGSTVAIKADTILNQPNALKVDGTATTQPVSVAGTVAVSASALPLPTGASTSANQSTELATLSAIATNTANTTVTQATGTNLHTVVDSGIVTANIGTTNGIALDSSVNTLLKPASTLAAVTTLGSIGSAVTIKADLPANQTNALKIDGSAVTQPVSVSGTVAVFNATLPLPAGASTAANQVITNTSVASIDSKTAALVSGRVPVDGSAVTQPISATVLPLPSGAATSAAQATLQTNISSIDSKTPVLGQALMITSQPVAIASNQSAIPVTGTFYQATQPVSVSGTIPVSGTVTSNIGTTNGLALDASVATVNTSVNTLLKPSSTLAAVTSVGAIASSVTIKPDTLINQTNALKVDATATTQPISATTLPLPSGAATSANQATELSTLATIAANTAVTTVTQATGSNLHTVIDSGAVTANIGTTNGLALDASVNTLLKPASTLAAVTSLSQFNGVPISLNTGVRDTGTLRVSIATNDIVPVSQSTLPWVISGASAVGSAPLYNPVSVSGVDSGGLKRIFKTDTTGTLLFSKTDGTKKTYSAAAISFTLGAAPTDILTITGSATATVKVNKLHLICNQNSGSYNDLVLTKRSTLNLGGISATPIIVALDSNNSTATAVVRNYTSAPTTLGTLIGNLRATKIIIPTLQLQTTGGNNSTLATESEFSWTASDLGQSFILRGANQQLALNLNGQTITGGICSGYMEFTEE